MSQRKINEAVAKLLEDGATLKNVLTAVETAMPDVRVIAVDDPEDTIIFGMKYVEREEAKLAAEERGELH